MALSAKAGKSSAQKRSEGLQKTPTGIRGLDEITGGGLPTGRSTLVCGSAGSGKTMLGLEFLLRGATEFDEPGVCMVFEETAEELAANIRSLGFDLKKLQAQNRVAVDYVHIERSEIHETGEYDLEALFIRLQHAIDTVGAKRVVLDTLEALFAGLPNEGVLRAELRRLFRWLKERGLTAVITGERGETTLTRFGLEEYVADCVILLDHRIEQQTSTRRLRVVKYRGSAHGTNEYPFLIGERGLSVLPITSLRLDHAASTRRISTGIPALDQMLSGKGFYRGSSILVSGAAGTGKSIVGVSFANAACQRGERAMIFCYEESPEQLQRNMRSIGIDLKPWLQQGLLRINATRPTMQGLEQHLLQMQDEVNAFAPEVVIVDPITNLSYADDDVMLKPALMRLIDFLKHRNVSALFTNLSKDVAAVTGFTQMGVSSLMDSWIMMSNLENNGERTRTLQVIKSRGMSHSNKIREFLISDQGVDLIDVFLEGDQVLTGTARVVHQQRAPAASPNSGANQAKRSPRRAARKSS
ncbi:circadian clock protein KaiC [Piscinibacter sakaiensis]|uniref:circadian clock protein KaiC n=1 Tax=Piscinibacter sakaiensis TaxID=1547922 RepID=UPI003AAF8B2F